MIQLEGKINKDCKIFLNEVEEGIPVFGDSIFPFGDIYIALVFGYEEAFVFTAQIIFFTIGIGQDARK